MGVAQIFSELVLTHNFILFRPAIVYHRPIEDYHRQPVLYSYCPINDHIVMWYRGYAFKIVFRGSI